MFSLPLPEYSTYHHRLLSSTAVDGKTIETRLDFLRPNLAARVEKSQYQQKQNHDRSSHERHFTIGDQVFVRSFQTAGPQWVAAVVTCSRGPVSYDVELADGRIVHRYIDHIQT